MNFKVKGYLFLFLLLLLLPFQMVAQESSKATPALESPLWYFGFFFGIIAFNVVVSMVQAFLSKDRAYLFYFLFVFLNLVYFLHYYEYYGGEKIFFNHFFPNTSGNIRILFLLSGYVMYNFFAIEFLKLKEQNPVLEKKLKRLAHMIIGIIAIFVFCTWVLGISSENTESNAYDYLHDLTILSVSILGVYGIYVVSKMKSNLARVLLWGASLYFIGSFIGFILTISTDFAIPLLQKYPLIPTQTGFILEILFFAIGLAYRAFEFEKEKDETHEKYIDQLQQTQKLELEHQDVKRYKEINQFRSKLFTNITHEFRTPLTVIIGMAEQLNENPDVSVESKVETIHRNGNQLLNLVNQLLEMSQLEEGSLTPKYIQGKVISYVKYLTQSYQSFAWSKKRSLSFYSGADEEFLMDYDPEKLQRILGNLISNSIKFTPEYGQIQVVVKKDDTNNILNLKVIDAGHGIPKDALAKVFERFYQVDDSNTKSAEGTGIGLALVKELTVLMEGEITVESEVGKGTTFDLFFPIKNNAPIQHTKIEITPQKFVHTINEEPSSEEELPVVEIDDEKPILLIIEDNKDVIEYLKMCLSPHYSFVVAKNGKEGVKEAIEKIPNIIISDVMMPEMDGFEVCEKLKNDPRTNHIPIILLTAKSTAKDRLEGLSKGADAYLIKPFNKNELLIRMESLLTVRNNILEKNNPQKEELPQDEFLQKFYSVVLENISDVDFGVTQLCHALKMSRTQVHRKIRALTDHSTTQLVRIIRLKEGKRLLELEDYNVSEVAYKVGYKNPGNFSTHFKSQFGISPSETCK